MEKNEVIKFAGITKQEVTDEELALINRQSLKTLTSDEVFTFKLAACNNLVDRDNERFTDTALEKLAELYVGKPIVSDHKWLAAMQTARIYAGMVEPMPLGIGKQLVLRAYMLRSDSTQATISAIEGGILREVSVGCRAKKAVCSVCGADKRKTACPHWPGNEYEGKKCHVSLDDPVDAYEVSFVAVPSQPAAGVTKTYGGEEIAPPDGESYDKDKTGKLCVSDRSLNIRASGGGTNQGEAYVDIQCEYMIDHDYSKPELPLMSSPEINFKLEGQHNGTSQH